MTPAISLILPTYNRARFLSLALESLCHQTLGADGFEVILVNDGSTDGTESVAAAFSDRLPLRYYRIEQSGLPSAKNVGVFAARAPLLLFFDDDDVAAPDLLAEHRRAHEDHPEPNVAILGHTGWDATLAVSPLMDYAMARGRLFAYDFISDGEVLDYRFFWGGRSSCKRSFLAQNGVFNPELTAAVEDVELGFRLVEKGLIVVHRRAARSFMVRSLTGEEFWRRCERQGAGRLVFSQLHPGVEEVQTYCQVETAPAIWSQAAPRLAAQLRRLAELEATFGEVVPSEPSEARDTLWSLYDELCTTFMAKGVVDAVSAGARVRGRLLDEIISGRTPIGAGV